jgi:transcriptional regulator with XRE-family HTH domain
MAQKLIAAFGIRIQHLRKLHKLTQEDLASATGFSVDTISNIERGRSSTRIETIGALAKALKVSLPELFDFDPTKPSKSNMKGVEKILKLVSDCPPDRLGKLITMIEHAVELVRD